MVKQRLRGKAAWTARPGILAIYTGRSARLLRAGHKVWLLTEASGGRMVVEAIGHKGAPVRFPVKTRNLGQPQPGLFDEIHDPTSNQGETT